MDAGLFTPAACSFILPPETLDQLWTELRMKAHLPGVGAGQALVGCHSFCARGTRGTTGSSVL